MTPRTGCRVGLRSPNVSHITGYRILNFYNPRTLLNTVNRQEKRGNQHKIIEDQIRKIK